MAPHLLVDISSHGYGHLAQVAPVLVELGKRLPGLRLTVRSTLPTAVLESRLGKLSRHIRKSLDVGMCMASAIDVEVEASIRAYAGFHSDWDGLVREEAKLLAALNPDLVLGDVPYLSMAGAARAGIPSLAMSSLNWGDIFHHYCGHLPQGEEIHAQIMDAYRKGQAFLQLAPHMPMDNLPRRRSLGPVAARGRNRRGELNRRLGMAPSERLVLIGLGGITTRLPVESWPAVPRIHWVVPGEWTVNRRRFLDFAKVNMPFTDLLCSCDAVITKPGYGTFAEAACNGVPVLYVERGDWPEEPYLTGWLSQNGVALDIERRALERGDLLGHLESLFARGRPPPIPMTGAGEAAKIVTKYLTHSKHPVPHMAAQPEIPVKMTR